MGSTPIKTQTVLAAVVILAIIEFIAAMAARGASLMPLAYLGMVRLLETAILLLLIRVEKEGLRVIGLDLHNVSKGFITGLQWSLGFAIIAVTGLVILHLLNFQALEMIKVPLPRANREVVIFFLVGGVIAPVAEEVFFRGILFGYFARWHLAAGVLLSSLIFVLFHPQGGLTQAVGGVVFALAYYHSRSLLAPIIIHSLGNMALFSISLYIRLVVA